MVFISVHKLLKLKKIPTDAVYYNIKFLQLKYQKFHIFQAFVGNPQRVDINICIKHRLISMQNELKLW